MITVLNVVLIRFPLLLTVIPDGWNSTVMCFSTRYDGGSWLTSTMTRLAVIVMFSVLSTLAAGS